MRENLRFIIVICFSVYSCFLKSNWPFCKGKVPACVAHPDKDTEKTVWNKKGKKSLQAAQRA